MTRARFAILLIAIVLMPGSAARGSRYGAPLPDPAGVIDLPAGFTYRIVSRTGDEMSDGLRVPALPDGMGAFRGPDGTTIVVCNHEAALGSDVEWLARVDSTKLYDRGLQGTPPAGGTTTFVWDTRSQRLIRRYLSLAGTLLNCSGGTTPWNTWLTCEETTLPAGSAEGKVRLGRNHGYVFEVPARADGGLVSATPLAALGRFTHEAVAYDERTGVLYQTEDVEDGLFYRFLPAVERSWSAGKLQALALRDGQRDTDNHTAGASHIRVRESLEVKWIDMHEVDAATDSLRYQGYSRGACRFDRPEGMCMINGAVYFACTSGGPIAAGQIWRYKPSRREGRAREQRVPGTLELYYEVPDRALVLNPDNICPTPDGDLLLCEDPINFSYARLVVLTRDRDVYTLARSRLRGEFTGAVFSPDGSTMFVNMQLAGITLAVTGPWKKK